MPSETSAAIAAESSGFRPVAVTSRAPSSAGGESRRSIASTRIPSKQLLEGSKMWGHGACLTHPAPQLQSRQSKMRGDGGGLVVDEIGEGLASGIAAVLSAAVMTTVAKSYRVFMGKTMSATWAHD